MTDADDNDHPSNPHDNDELAKKLAGLSEERRTKYQTQVDITIELYGSASDAYRLKLANTFLKNLPAGEGAEINEHRRQEAQRISRKQLQQQNQATSALASPQQHADPERGAGNKSIDARLQPDLPSPAKEPAIPPRDYTALNQTHEQLAGPVRPDAERAPLRPATPSPEATTPILSKQQLVLMIEHFPDIRREAGIIVTQSEIKESADLARAQNVDQQRLEHKHAAQPHPRHLQEHDLLNHQHLAERVGVEAKWIAQHLKAQRSPDADIYMKDSQHAFHTARVVHEHRRHLEADRPHSNRETPAAQAGQDQTQARLQQAAQAGVDLTPEQRANASPEVRQTVERKEHSAAMREVLARFGDENARQGMAKPGNSRGGGRSR